jgi:ABC-type sugar transport system ATPase subunit
MPEADSEIRGRIDIVEPLGSTLLLHVNTGISPLLVRVVVPSDTGLETGRAVGLRLRADRLHRFDEATGRVCD